MDEKNKLYKRFMNDYFLMAPVLRYVERVPLTYDQVFLIVQASLVEDRVARGYSRSHKCESRGKRVLR